MPTLNLTDYQEMSNDAVPRGRYFVEVVDMEERETRNDGETPAGTPMIWAHVKVTGKVGETEVDDPDYEYYNRRAFTNLVVPPENHDPKKAKFMNGRIVSLFKALGVSEEEITSGEFDPDYDDFIESKLVVDLSVDKKDPTQNRINGFRSLDSVDTAVSGGSGLI